jgi:hypothetical protein
MYLYSLQIKGDSNKKSAYYLQNVDSQHIIVFRDIFLPLGVAGQSKVK